MPYDFWVTLMRFTAFYGRVRKNKLIKNLISKYS